MPYHDLLTGLASKMGFEQQLQRILTETRSHQLHGLLYLDLDRFRLINETCGRVAGDEALRQLAGILGEQVRESDVLARLGGDEFAVLLPHCDMQHAVDIAELLLQAINDFHFTWEEQDFTLGASVGLVCVDGDTLEIDRLLKQADLACYTAKALGRNRVHVFKREDREMTGGPGEMAWASRIRHALDEQRLVLYVQQLVPLKAPAPVEQPQELLVRMVDQQGRIIPPGSFLRAAESYDLMYEVDRWVVRHALQGMSRDNRDSAADHGLFFIKLSAAVFSDAGFCDYVLRQLEESGVPPARICFVMSETTAITQLPLAVPFISKIRSLGGHCALNRFGSGLSAFSYLKTIPVDYLKVDGTLIRNIAENEMDRAIVEAINRIAQIAKVKTIAECVETVESYRILHDLGLDFAQGAYLSEPTPWQ